MGIWGRFGGSAGAAETPRLTRSGAMSRFTQIAPMRVFSCERKGGGKRGYLYRLAKPIVGDGR